VQVNTSAFRSYQLLSRHKRELFLGILSNGSQVFPVKNHLFSAVFRKEPGRGEGENTKKTRSRNGHKKGSSRPDGVHDLPIFKDGDLASALGDDYPNRSGDLGDTGNGCMP
jgi:hypothetical protein